MADSQMKKDPIMKAVGFRINNLKAFPVSRLPRDIQVEMIEEVGMNEKIELFNVTSIFREYFTRNGIFGKHVDEITIALDLENVNDEEEIYIQEDVTIYVEKDCRRLDDQTFDFRKHRALFRYLSSCTGFTIEDEYETDNDDDYGSSSAIDENMIEANEVVKNIGKWFPNLRFVERLTMQGLWRHPMKQEILESFRFKVTKFAEFANLYASDWVRLTNQLSICENVFLRDSACSQFPGMEIENDSKKKNEILDAFEKFTSHSWSVSNLFRCLANTPNRLFSIKCYRRKIAEDKEMIVLADS